MKINENHSAIIRHYGEIKYWYLFVIRNRCRSFAIPSYNLLPKLFNEWVTQVRGNNANYLCAITNFLSRQRQRRKGDSFSRTRECRWKHSVSSSPFFFLILSIWDEKLVHQADDELFPRAVQIARTISFCPKLFILQQIGPENKIGCMA